MKCHYEILNIPRDADKNEIKAAYRKLALKWHPDKNLNDPDEAKQQFQLVQQAYEVLSDHQERAWYDNHREEILRGGQTNYEDNSLDIFQYFTSSCFKGFDDSPGSFYSVYTEVFSKLASEDIEYMDDPEEYDSIPIFGDSQSPFDVVHKFYSYWQSYSTRKSYAWLSPYNINEVRDRRVLKLVDKENKKVQQKARRERNEQVRQLVQFVRKRDKRVIAQRKVEEERIKLNKSRVETMRKEQIKQRREELTAQVNSLEMEDLENRLREIERNLSDEFGNTNDSYSNDSENNSESDLTTTQYNDSFTNGSKNESCKNENDIVNLDNFYCVACNKLFKTSSSFENHEKSKRHKERIAILLQDMQEESTDENKESNQKVVEEIEQNEEFISEEDKIQISDDHVPVKVSPKPKNKNKQKVKPKIFLEEDELITNNLKQTSSDDDDMWNAKNKSKQKKFKVKGKSKISIEAKVEVIVPNKSIEDARDINRAEKMSSVDIDHVCVTCNEKFISKNKLFTHLKSSGHGVALDNKTILKKGKRLKR